MSTETITAAEWKRTHSDYRTGSPRAGTARVLRYDPATGGTVLVPVEVTR